MVETEWIEIGTVVGDTGPKGDTGDTGIGTTIKGTYNTYADLVNAHPRSTGEDAYLIDGEIYYWNVNDNKWESGGSIKGNTGDTGSKGDTGDTGAIGPKGDKGDTGTSIKILGSYSSYEELISEHPTGNDGDSYLVNGFLYLWDSNAWKNVGNIKGEKGDTGDTGLPGVKGDTGKAFTYEDFTEEQLANLKGDTGVKGDTGDSGFSPIVNVDHTTQQIIITSENSSVAISFDELRGDTGDTGDAFTFDDFTEEQLASLKGVTGDTGPKGDTGIGSDEESGWKLPVDEILTTNTLPTGVSIGYRVAICTSSVMAIKEYNGTSWDSETLNQYSVIPLKQSGSIQMYLAKASGPVYMGVEYGVFGKFRFMTQTAYDNLSSYDEDTIYFVRSS